MSERVQYKTVKKYASTVIIEKKSKFISSVYPVADEKDALARLAEVKKQYPDATHNVYAYVIDENNIFRYTDDGEPSGTAGMPVLDTIRKEGIVDVLVVVTRYFGGTLLGTGGLVHAYGASARSGLLAAEIITRLLCNRIYIRVAYTLTGRLNHEIAKSKYILEDTVYDELVTYILLCRLEDTEKLISEFTEMSNGSAEITVMNQAYIDLAAE